MLTILLYQLMFYHIQEATPAFRETTRKVFNRASGTLDEVPVPPSHWNADIAEAFFARQVMIQ